MTTPGRSVWCSTWDGEKAGPLLAPIACPSCRRHVARLVRRLVCDCGWEGWRAAEAAKAATRPKPIRGDRYLARVEQVRAYLLEHPWSSRCEIAAACGVSADYASQLLAEALRVRQRPRQEARRGRATIEYALAEEAVAC